MTMWYRLSQTEPQTENIVQRPLDIPMSDTLRQIVGQLNSNGWKPLIVGGSVRDAVMGYEPKDIDVEVYNCSWDELASVLSQFGRIDQVGKSFGVIKFRDPEGNDYDFSIPRRDNKTGVGHKDFTVTFDKEITPKEAASRRDFTINAMAYDPATSEIHDYYGGLSDIDNHILRATSPAFMEDPLRVLRGMQFAARFDMKLDPETAEMCKAMGEHYGTLPKERLKEEWMKLATKGKFPGTALEFLVQSGWIEYYPRLAQIIGVPQDPEWHPEGTVDIHTAHVMNSAAEIASRVGLEGKDRAVLVLSAMTHDLAKSYPEHGGTTEQREKGGKMRWTSHGHEKAGGPMAKELLESMGIDRDVISKVVPLVEDHLYHANFQKSKVQPKDVRTLADRLKPASIQELLHLIESDASGRPPLPKALPKDAMPIRDMAEQENLLHGAPQQIIMGKDVLPYFGGKPGAHIGEAVKAAYKAYLEGKYHDKEGGIAWLNQYLYNKAGFIKGRHVLPYFDKPGPHIREVTDKAWQAQMNGDFSDEEGANAWLENHMNQPKSEPPTNQS